MKNLQKILIEKITKASKYIQDAYFKQIPFRFATKEEIKNSEEKIITLDLFPKLNGKNKNGRYVDEDSFMKCMNEFIEKHKKMGVTYFELAPDKDTDTKQSVYFDVLLSNIVGAIKKIYFDDATNSYKCDITLIGEYKNLSDMINNEQYCLATVTEGTFKIDDNDIRTNYYTEIIKVLLYLRKEIDPALENTIENYKEDVEWDEEKGTVKINNPLPLIKKDYYF